MRAVRTRGEPSLDSETTPKGLRFARPRQAGDAETVSKRDMSGAFDSLVRAVVGLGATPSWTALPPPTTPGSLARGLGQGLLQGRLPREAKGTGGTAPQPAEALQHEGQRSVAEFGAILWYAMGGPDDAPELAPWMAPAHADPIVALTLSRQRLGEYAVREPIDRNCPFPGPRVWLIEIERAKGDVPAGLAVWRSPGPNGEWRTRCACVWTHGRIGTAAHPLVIGAQWGREATDAVAGACVLGPSWNDAARAAKRRSRNAVLERRQNLIGKHMIAQIAVPAALAWLDAHAGSARRAGHVEAKDADAGNGARIVVPVPGAARTPPPAWLIGDVARAAEAIVIGAAREGWRTGASCPVEPWRRGWAGYAEAGAVAWRAISNLRAPIDAETWSAMERSLGEENLEERSRHPALAATSALVRTMLEQTGRNHVARGPDERTLCALEVPRRLWRALGEAGPCPGRAPEPDLTERWWLVEIEAPPDDEPNAVALWESEGAQIVLAAFLHPRERGQAPFVTVVTWRTGADGERSAAGLAALRAPIHADDPDNPTSRAGLEQVVETLAAPAIGAIARAKTAITVHLESDGRAAPLAQYRSSAGGATARGETARGDTARRGKESATGLFAIERAPEPERAEPHGAGGGQGPGGRRPLEERQRVRAHWKRQAFGPRLSRRRRIVVESYERGPAPHDDQIVMTRLAEGKPQAGRANDRQTDVEPRRAKE